MSAWTLSFEPGLALLLLMVLLPQIAVAAPVNEQTTDLEYYPVADSTGCYYNFQHYDEGDRIITNEPCLNCTCHNRMLMCYLRVCPFTKAIGQDCKVEKRSDQCCPVITCPEVPVQLLTSTTQSSTEVGHLNEYGCSIEGLFYSDGARVPSDINNPCELCYCIRNKTACVMQECTLKVEGCKPVYQEGVCCPVRYDCEHPDYNLLETTTPKLITTTTPATTTLPGPVDCIYNNEIYADGALIIKEKPCEHCYCMRGDIVCAVQECGPTPLDKVNCTALPIKEGQCCPDTYDCENISEEELTTGGYLDITTTPASVKYDHATTIKSTKEEEENITPLITDRDQFSTETSATKLPEQDQEATALPPKEGEITPEAVTVLPSETEKERETEKPELTESSMIPEIEDHEEPLKESGVTPLLDEGVTKETVSHDQVTEQPELTTTKSKEPSEIENEIPSDHGLEVTTTEKEEEEHVPEHDDFEQPEESEYPAHPLPEEGKPEHTTVLEEGLVTELPHITELVPETGAGTETPHKPVAEGKPEEGTTDIEEQEESKTTQLPEVATTALPPKSVTETKPEEPSEVPEHATEHITEEEPEVTEISKPITESVAEVTTSSIFEGKPTELPDHVTEKGRGTEVPKETDVHTTEVPQHIPGEGIDTELPQQPVTEPAEGIATQAAEQVTEGVTQEAVTDKTIEHVTIPVEGEVKTTETPSAPITEGRITVHPEEFVTTVIPTEDKVTELPEEPQQVTEGEDHTTEHVHKESEGPEPPQHAPEGVTEAIEEQHVTDQVPQIGTGLPQEAPVTEASPEQTTSEHVPSQVVTEQRSEQGVTTLPQIPQQGEEGPTTKLPETHEGEVPEHDETHVPVGDSEHVTEPDTYEETKPPKTPEDNVVTTETTQAGHLATSAPSIEGETEKSLEITTESAQPVDREDQVTSIPGGISESAPTEHMVIDTTGKYVPEGTLLPEIGETTQISEHVTGKPVEESGTKQPEQPTESLAGEGKVTELPQVTEATTSQEHITASVSEQEKSTEHSAEGKPVEGQTAKVPEFVTQGLQEEDQTTPLQEQVTQGISQETLPTELPQKPTTEAKPEEAQVTQLPEEVTEIAHDQVTEEVPTEDRRTDAPQQPVSEEHTTALPEHGTEGVTEEGSQETLPTELPQKPILESKPEKAQVTQLPEAVTEIAHDQVTEEVPTEDKRTDAPQQPVSEEHTTALPEHGTEGVTEEGKLPESTQETVTESKLAEHVTELAEHATEHIPPDEGKITELPEHVTELEQGTVLPQEPVTDREIEHITERKPEEVTEIPELATAGESATSKPTLTPEEHVTEAKEEENKVTELLSEPVTQSVTEKSVTEEIEEKFEYTTTAGSVTPSDFEEGSKVTEEPVQPQVHDDLGQERPEEEEHGIPGEGSCLVDGQTYKNNSSVPPINHCQISCKCISSILQCESVNCTPPPSNLQNCMPVFHGPDSCCPTYSCTVPGVTMMESDSHKMETTTKEIVPEEPVTIAINVIPSEDATSKPVPTTETIPEKTDTMKPEYPEHTEEAKEGVTEEIKPAEHITETSKPVPTTETIPEKTDTMKPESPEHTEEDKEGVTEEIKPAEHITEIAEEPSVTDIPIHPLENEITTVKATDGEPLVTSERPEEGVTQGEAVTTLRPIEHLPEVEITTAQSSEEAKQATTTKYLEPEVEVTTEAAERESVTGTPLAEITANPVEEEPHFTTSKYVESEPGLTTAKSTEPEQPQPTDKSTEHVYDGELTTAKTSEAQPQITTEAPIEHIPESELTTVKISGDETYVTTEVEHIPEGELTTVKTDVTTVKSLEGELHVTTSKPSEEHVTTEQVTDDESEGKVTTVKIEEEPKVTTEQSVEHVSEGKMTTAKISEEPQVTTEQHFEQVSPDQVTSVTISEEPQVTTEKSPEGEVTTVNISEEPELTTKTVEHLHEQPPVTTEKSVEHIPEGDVTTVRIGQEPTVATEKPEEHIPEGEATTVNVLEEQSPVTTVKTSEDKSQGTTVQTVELTTEFATMKPSEERFTTTIKPAEHVPESDITTVKVSDGESKATTEIPHIETEISTEYSPEVGAEHDEGVSVGQVTHVPVSEEGTGMTTEHIEEHVVTEGVTVPSETEAKPEITEPERPDHVTEHIPSEGATQDIISEEQTEKVTTIRSEQVTETGISEGATEAGSTVTEAAKDGITHSPEQAVTEGVKESAVTESVKEGVSEGVTHGPEQAVTEAVKESSVTEGVKEGVSEGVTHGPEQGVTEAVKESSVTESVEEGVSEGVTHGPEQAVTEAIKESSVTESVKEGVSEGITESVQEAEPAVTKIPEPTTGIHETATQPSETEKQPESADHVTEQPEEGSGASPPEHDETAVPTEIPQSVTEHTKEESKPTTIRSEIVTEPGLSGKPDIEGVTESSQPEQPISTTGGIIPDDSTSTPVSETTSRLVPDGSTSAPIAEHVPEEEEAERVDVATVPAVTESEVSETTNQPEHPIEVTTFKHIPEIKPDEAETEEPAPELPSATLLPPTSAPEGVTDHATPEHVTEQEIIKETAGQPENGPEIPSRGGDVDHVTEGLPIETTVTSEISKETNKPIEAVEIGITTKPTEEVSLTEKSEEVPKATEEPIAQVTEKTRPAIPGEGQEPVEDVYTSPQIIESTTQYVQLNATSTDLYTSGPQQSEQSTKKSVEGELSTSGYFPTTLQPTTSTLPPSSEAPEESPDYQQPTGEEEYGEEGHGVFGPGTCRYGGKVYVSAQQIPRDDPCDFCFCFRSDIICLQQSCPPPIPRCHEEPIPGFCCPRYECPVSMATSVNITTTTTTTTTTLPPHFLSHAYKGRAARHGCQIQNKAYEVGEEIKSASGPCLHCTCGGDGQMKCDPLACTPAPMLRQMMVAAASRRRR